MSDARFSCPSCGAALRVPESAVSKKIRCPGCKQVLRLTEETPESPSSQTAPVLSSKEFEDLSRQRWVTAVSRFLKIPAVRWTALVSLTVITTFSLVTCGGFLSLAPPWPGSDGIPASGQPPTHQAGFERQPLDALAMAQT